MRKYKVTGTAKTDFAVLMANGAIEYDCLESRQEAKDICAVLNRGIGPEWDAVERALPQPTPRNRED